MTDSIKKQLSKLNITSYHYNWANLPLEALVKRAGLSIVKYSKPQLIRTLETYLSSTTNLKEIWDKLSELEKAIVTDAVINQHYLLMTEASRLCKLYGQTQDSLTKNSLMCLYFIDGRIPDCIASLLEKFIERPGLEIKHELVNGKTLRQYRVFRNKDTLAQDWVKVVQLAGTGQLKVTKAGQYPTKPSLKNINKIISHQEYEGKYISIDSMKNGKEATRLYGLITHMLAAGVLQVEKTNLTLGPKGNHFLSIPFAEQAKLLFEGYQNNHAYNEVERIKASKLEVALGHKMPEVRKKICRLLCGLPEGEWVNMGAIKEQLYKCWRTFLVEEVQTITIKENNYYYGDIIENWEEVEARYLDVLILEGLVPLGLMDVALQEDVTYEDYTLNTYHFFKVAYIKITPLGAYLFGKSKDYIDPSTQGQVPNDLWVDEGLVIHVGKSTKKYQHEIFFDHFCEKLIKEEESLYALNFYAALKAFNEEITLSEILEYLKRQCTKPLPSQVELVFKQWQKDQQKVTIKNVMVIECEDQDIMKDLLESQTIRKSEGKELKHTIAFSKKHLNKVKKEIEKKNYFCNIRLEEGE